LQTTQQGEASENGRRESETLVKHEFPAETDVGEEDEVRAVHVHVMSRRPLEAHSTAAIKSFFGSKAS
jgi:hypothetical protein